MTRTNRRAKSAKCALCATVIVIAGAADAEIAQADDIQKLSVAITPTKLDKKKPKPVQLYVDIATGPNSGASVNQDQPPNADRTVVDFPKNLTIDTGSTPRCDVSADALENTTTEQAIELCGKDSIISVPSGSSSHVSVDTDPFSPGSPLLPIDVVLTAFNGHDPNTLYFHNRADLVKNTTILREELKKSKAGAKYGTSLITNIPPIQAGAPDDFKVTIKKGTIVSGICKSKLNPFKLTTSFLDWAGGSEFSSTTQTACTQKPSKKK